MSEREKLKTGDVAAFAAGPGRTRAQAGSRFTHWREAGIVPTEEKVWGPGGHAYVFPQSTGAIAAILFDLFDAGIVTDKRQLGRMWRFFGEAHENRPSQIDLVLNAVAAGECCWLIIVMWQNEETGEPHPTCSTRFVDDYDRPVPAPSASHVPVAEYVVNLHVLLKRFATQDSNVQPMRAEAV